MRRKAQSSLLSFFHSLLLSSLGIRSQHPHKIGQLSQVPQCLLRYFVVFPALEIDVEEILPRLAAQRTRLDLGQVQIAKRKGAQAPEERSGNVPRREHQRCLPDLHRTLQWKHAAFRVQQEEAREILAIVLN